MHNTYTHINTIAKIKHQQILSTHQILTNRSPVADVIKWVSPNDMMCCNSLPWAGNFLIGLLPLEGPLIGHNLSDMLPVNNELPMMHSTTTFCLSADQHLVMSCDVNISSTYCTSRNMTRYQTIKIWQLANFLGKYPNLLRQLPNFPGFIYYLNRLPYFLIW